MRQPLLIIAFYLPQYHPIPENDNWWGKGFTEWTNVTRAKPLFRGHYQPHLPADLGFYDLRLPEARQDQAELAREYGICGFCYYHYWFAGKQLLERPLNEVLKSGTPNFPFCLCWANETWSRRWLGEESHILIKQVYSFEDDIAHGHALASIFSDSRYIQLDGRPLFLIYRPYDLPDPLRTTDIFRQICINAGISNPYIVGVNAHCRWLDCRRIGFDNTLDFRPQLGALRGAFYEGLSFRKLYRNMQKGIISATLNLYEYDEAIAQMESINIDFPNIPSVFVSWDNTPRRNNNSIVIANGTPQQFELYLANAIVRSSKAGTTDRVVFINAWNEWGEGNYLEPDQKFGRAFLLAVKNTLNKDHLP